MSNFPLNSWAVQTPAIVKQQTPSQSPRLEDTDIPPMDKIVGIPALHDANISVDIISQNTLNAYDKAKVVKDRTPERLQLDEKHTKYEWIDVLESQLMTQESSDRRVICFTLKSRDGELLYRPGDSVAVPPQNDPEVRLN